ncbi:URC4/urg3 family protein [soil metagenome]
MTSSRDVDTQPKSETRATDSAVAALRRTTAIRERAGHLLQRARDGGSQWFLVDDLALETAASEVVDVTRVRYPDLQIPFHSRWRHFEAGDTDRKTLWGAELDTYAMIDLAVVSVLLDAGAGANWRYDEALSGQQFARSEGLGVASWHAFTAGLFSSDPRQPLQADADGLRHLDTGRLAAAFQVGPSNPLLGLEGRVAVLRRLGDALAARPQVFGTPGRPGGLYDLLVYPDDQPTVAADDILAAILTYFSEIWPAHNAIDNQPLGDCWHHRAVPGPGTTAGWMPFHKLSQWLTYSLLEPFQWSGIHVDRLDSLTGLPEYRNGGLLLDTGVLRLRDAQWANRSWAVGDELVVEWRALTVALLDELAPLVQNRLGDS